MLLENISHNELQQMMSHLDQAIYNHQQWHNTLIRTLVCRLIFGKIGWTQLQRGGVPLQQALTVKIEPRVTLALTSFEQMHSTLDHSDNLRKR
jgi:hypothetical protein